MKKVKLLFLVLCSFMVLPFVVNAASANINITGGNSVTVGNTTKVYVKLNSSDKIEGVDITYSVSGNISVTSVALGSGLSKVAQNGNRYILYAQNPLSSGSNILILTVKGTAKGSGTITISNTESTISSTTVSSSDKSFRITVNNPTTEPTVTPDNPTSDDQKEALALAKELVAKAEETLSEDDYTSALKAVNGLAAGDDKDALLKRLEEVKFQIAVKKECKVCDSTEPCDVCEENSNEAKAWIILSIILFVCLVLETIYLVIRLSKEN